VTRIAQLANFYAPTSGGLRVAVDELRAGYAANGHRTTLIIPGEHDRADNEVVEIAAPRLPGGSGYRVILSRRAVLDALDHAEPDLIEVHDKLLQRWAWKWARARGRPLLAFSHERLDATLAEFMPRLAAHRRGQLTGLVTRRVLKDCDRVVACSAFAAKEFQDSPKVRTVPLGVDLDHFRPDCVIQTRSTVRLITVGRLSAEKRPDIAIAALAELLGRGVRAELTLLGTGPWEKRLRSQSAGLPVRFAGFLDSDEVAAHLAGADISLAPGPAETFGLAALEALACGTPTVAVSGSATADFFTVNGHAGRAVALDPTAFADAVCELLKLPVPTRRQAARSVAESFSWKRTVTAMLELHAELVAENGMFAQPVRIS
jgi:alpha-1,6-mannosyltransferase